MPVTIPSDIRRQLTALSRLTFAAAVVLICFATAPAWAELPDLDVTFIARTPRYKRYVIDESRGLPQQLAPGTENDKRWPDTGEIVTYTAHVINKGKVAAAPFAYHWQVDGVVVEAGTAGRDLEPGEETTISYRMPWTTESRRIELVADPLDEVPETVETNNSLATGSHDLTLSFWVERGMYDLFDQRVNLTGSQSFEDWLQAQMAWMNERFAMAIYPTSPSGVVDRVRIDKIVVADDLDGPGSPMLTDPDLLLIDGRWPISDGDPTNARGQGGAWLEFVELNVGRIDHGLVHEVAHQLGIIDLYEMNIKNNEPPDPNGGVSVKDANGNIIPYDRLPFPVFCCGGLMGGGDTRPYDDETFFESHTAAGMNTHAGHRRGHYGEYLFDTPARNRIRIVDAFGRRPVADADVALYQKDYSTEDIDDAPEITGRTDARGFMTLPNRPVVAVRTATGHALRSNPFGQINPVGSNGTMLAVVTKKGLQGLAFLTLHDLNLAYHQSARESVNTYELQVRLAAPAPPPSNLPPVLVPIGAKTVAEGEPIEFSVAAFDPAGDAITITAPRIPQGASFGKNTFTWTPTLAQAGFHSVTFLVTDEGGQTDSETIQISVLNTNAAPVAIVGPDQVAGTNALVTLDGKDSFDPDHDVLSYLWTQTAGPTVALSDSASPTPTFVAPASGDVRLTFSLIVSDGMETSAPATIVVDIHPTLTLAGNGEGGGFSGAARWRQACSGSDRLLVVTTAEWRADDDSQVSAIAYAGVPLVRVASIYHPGTGPLATMWALVDPPAGLHEVSASIGNAFASFGSSCWYGVAQTLPAVSAATFGSSATPTVVLATAGGEMVVDGISTFGENAPASLSAGAGQSLLAHTFSVQSRAGHSARTAGAGSTTMTWSNSGSDSRWAIVAAVLQPAN